MKSRKTAVLFFILFICLRVQSAEPAGFGLGIMLGEPTGISAKKWLTANTAVDGALAWSLNGEGSFHIHADFLLHKHDIFNPREFTGRMSLYYGPGLTIRSRGEKKDNNNTVRLGIRFPVGMTYIFSKTPVDIFLEIVPVFDLVPETDLSLHAAIGVRYYF